MNRKVKPELLYRASMGAIRETRLTVPTVFITSPCLIFLTCELRFGKLSFQLKKENIFSEKQKQNPLKKHQTWPDKKKFKTQNSFETDEFYRNKKEGILGEAQVPEYFI